MSKIELADGQIWCPSNGERSRQIVKIWSAGLTDKYLMGTIILHWAATMDKQGVCTAASFKAWIKKAKAVLLVQSAKKVSM